MKSEIIKKILKFLDPKKEERERNPIRIIHPGRIEIDYDVWVKNNRMKLQNDYNKIIKDYERLGQK